MVFKEYIPMKKLFTLAVLSLCSLLLAPCSNAQGNLQFNQVLSYAQLHGLSSCGSNVCSWTGPTYTVPTGKVWKIEYFAQGGQYPASLLVNSSFDITSVNNGSPVWLKAGDQIQLRRVCTTANCASGGSYLLSIIEFNVVP